MGKSLNMLRLIRHFQEKLFPEHTHSTKTSADGSRTFLKKKNIQSGMNENDCRRHSCNAKNRSRVERQACAQFLQEIKKNWKKMK